MTDIVERLRLDAEPTESDMEEAATEIDRLREALRFYACQCKDDMSCETFGEYGRSECGHTARTALGEDK